MVFLRLRWSLQQLYYPNRSLSITLFSSCLQERNLSYAWVRQSTKPWLRLEARPTPFLTNPHDVQVEVKAASVNPIDVAMTVNFGKGILDLYRASVGVRRSGPSSLCGNTEDYSSAGVLGRDFSGTVTSVGHSIRRFRPGDDVYGALHPSEAGTHAQYILASEHDIASKPENLSYVEAAAVPYAALTFLSALRSAGVLRGDLKGKRVFMNCGAGGIGTFAIQYLKSFGCEVSVSVSPGGSELVAGLDPDHVLDYTSSTYEEELRRLAGFDVAFDAAGDETALSCVRPGGRFVTVVSPLLKSTDSDGLLLGGLQASVTLAQKVTQAWYAHGVHYHWGFFSPDGVALEEIKGMIERDTIRPIVDEVFPFSRALDAYEKVGLGTGRGKVIIDVADNS